MKKCIVFCAFIGLSLSAAAQVTVVDSGDCGASGNNLTWVLTSDSVLTICGSGDMKNYSLRGAAWYSYGNIIKTIIIGDSITSIGFFAFYNCRCLETVMIGNSVTSTGEWAFFVCSSLTAITIPNNVTNIGYGAFAGCSNLTSITIPNSVTSIGGLAFYECCSLISITIPDSITSIEGDVFSGCSSLTSITIPNNVRSIGDYAFYNCRSLTSIMCKAGIPPVLGWDVFYDVPDSIPIYVSCQSIDDYRNDAEWSYFSNFVTLPPDTTYYSETVCQGSTYSDEYFTAVFSGTHYFSITCDSVVCLTLTEKNTPTVSNLAVSKVENGFVITWQGSAYSYKLYREDDLRNILTFVNGTNYIDNDVTADVRYCYKVKAIEDGCESDYSNEVCETYHDVGIVETHCNASLQVYPNPVHNELRVTSYEGGEMQIYDVVGKVVTNFQFSTFNSQLNIDVSHLAKGVYFLKVDGKMVRFVKE